VVDLDSLLPAQDFGAVDTGSGTAVAAEAVSVCAGARAGRLKVLEAGSAMDMMIKPVWASLS
jgi:hypothetical protein